MEEIKPRRIKVLSQVSEEVLKKDLKRYVKKTIEAGATEARIISADEVQVDERVRLKCLVPRCHLYGETPNCPPWTPEPEQMRRVLSKYRFAVVFKHDVEPVDNFADAKKWHKSHMAHQGKTHQIVSEIESLAFNDGYYLAAGFAAGGCKTALCAGQVCQFLDSGRCRFPLRARPSMEGVGIDVFGLAAKIGWEVYPIAHRDVAPEFVPCAISVGIVFIN